MTRVILLTQINPIRLANERQSLKGHADLSQMPRLRQSVLGKLGMAQVELFFGQDERHYYYVTGRIQAELNVICQRCNHPMPLNLNIAIALSPVRTDKEAAELPSDYDPLMLAEDAIVSITDIIEDEILLSIPMIPKHPSKVCKEKVADLKESKSSETLSRPFDILKKLL